MGLAPIDDVIGELALGVNGIGGDVPRVKPEGRLLPSMATPAPAKAGGIQQRDDHADLVGLLDGIGIAG